MGVSVGAVPVGAFISLVVAVVLILATVAARRHGHIQGRHLLWIISTIVFVLIVYGLGFGVIQPW